MKYGLDVYDAVTAAGGQTQGLSIGVDGTVHFDEQAYPWSEQEKAVVFAALTAYTAAGCELTALQDRAIALCREFCNTQILAMYSREHQNNVQAHCTLRLARWLSNLSVPEGLYTADDLYTMTEDINKVRSECFDVCERIKTLGSSEEVQAAISALCLQYGVPNVQL